LETAKSLRWFVEPSIVGLPCRINARARYQHNRDDIPAILDCADTINNPSGLIECKRYLGQATEIALWMRTHHKPNLWRHPITT